MIGRFKSIRDRIEVACAKVGRASQDIRLVAVSKKQPLDALMGYQHFTNENSFPCMFGENYIQEAREKAAHLDPATELHFIGGLQTNKVKEAVRLCHVIESVDSVRLAEEINKQAQSIQKIQRIMLQVNVSNDKAKGGFSDGALESFLTLLQNYSSLKFEGLMTITALYENPADARNDFRRMANLGAQAAHLLGLPQTSLALSMGMSSDFEVAIEEGATHVRIGSALFGERS